MHLPLGILRLDNQSRALHSLQFRPRTFVLICHSALLRLADLERAPVAYDAVQRSCLSIVAYDAV